MKARRSNGPPRAILFCYNQDFIIDFMVCVFESVILIKYAPLLSIEISTSSKFVPFSKETFLEIKLFPFNSIISRIASDG